MSAGAVRTQWIAVLLVGLALCGGPARGADLSAASDLFRTGDYAACLEATAEGVEDAYRREDWGVLRLKVLMTLGRYAEAVEALDAALTRSPNSIRLRWIGRDVCRFAGDAARGDQLLGEMSQLIASQSWRYRVGGADLVTVGHYRLETGADPKAVLDREWTSAQRSSSGRVPALLACGELALSKEDYGLAKDYFDKAVLFASDEPDGYVGLARALRPSNAEGAQQAIDKALELNGKHFGAMLFQVDAAIDRESYDEAKQLIASVLEINAFQPEALAYRAVIETVVGTEAEAKKAYDLALSSWSANPAVPHLVGRKLSQKYRFAEGAGFQQIALDFDPGYLQAKSQLSSDLLRLGDEEAGWKSARDVAEADPYNVEAYNLVTLESRLSDYVVLEEGSFRVRMERTEAKVYGDRVLALLIEAADVLPKKYETTLPERITVDIYAKQADFAIRTFGLPGGAGFLGVCFGPVVTMNSPASLRQNRTSWESVLWHEFTHVVTLTRTRNRMPRWLSEGISVYEERLKDSRWGQRISPTYRNMMLGEELTPVSQLSAAFLTAPSSVHLQFAYFESALVVEFLVESFGIEALNAVLGDLADGVLINDALSRHAMPIDDLDALFEEHAKSLAEGYAPGLDFSELQRTSRFQNRSGPLPANNWTRLRREIAQLAARDQLDEAYAGVLELVAHFAFDQTPVELLREKAALERRLTKEAEFLKTTRQIAGFSSDAFVELRTLIAEAVEREDQKGVIERAEDMLAIDPLIAYPHEVIASAARRLGDLDRERHALEALLALDRADVAGRRYRLAELAFSSGRLDEARRHVLLALEEAPRYADAYRLLLKIRGQIDDDRKTKTMREEP